MNWPVTIGIVAAFMSAALAASFFVNRQQEQRSRALSVITRNKALGFKEESKEKQLAKQRADIARKLKDAGKDEEKKDTVTVKDLLIQAGFEGVSPVRYWIYSGFFAIFVWLFLSGVSHWPKIAIIFATIAAFLGVPRKFLRIKAGKRQKKFLSEFPDALDASVRLLQSGMPITEAVAMAAREFTGPLREEMQRIYENQKIGVTIGQAALETARRIPLTEVYMFATALQIQSETGSSLSEVLSNLSSIIRARFRLKRKIQALSSEAKASAMIIGALPVLVTFGLYCANPAYVSLLWTTEQGKTLAAGAIGWMSIGVFIMRQMINFRI
jgi:tight adherence protein B